MLAIKLLLYVASPKLVTESTNYSFQLCINPEAGKWEAFTKKLLQPITESTDRMSAFIEQLTSPKLDTEPTDLIHSTLVDSRVGQEVSTNSLRQVAPTIYRNY